ncbi:hypothetical protein A4A49_08200 [Nicotiana attenuata]|uniref:DUF4283 domain-containing protein n=1 Tax=Nicotiana attenuata TaxID=49451 RepID=A0A314L7I8_NICAT|nr:hypothetical protein A4A49_08200 [Nicotiana attenuata]
MDPPDGAAPARLEGQSTPCHMANQISELIDTKLTYATKIISSSNHLNPPNCHGRDFVVATHTTYNGMPTILFKASDYYGVMAEECKLTIVGRFLKPRPQIDKIRSKFKELISIKGSVKIDVFDNYNIFLDFTNEEDFSSVWFRRVIEIEGQQMWLQKWSPDFKPEEDLPIALVWVLLPGLPFYMHTWNYVKQVVSTIGTPLEMDLAIRGRTRPSMAKVRVEIDLLKDQPNSVYVGQIYDNAPQKSFVQKIEFEGNADANQNAGANQNDQKNASPMFNRELELNAQNSGANQNVENKGTNLNNKKEVYENGKAINNGQDRNSITHNQLKQKNGNEFDNHQQKYSSNIRERSRKNTKKSIQRKLPKKKAKVTFKPMLNLSYDTNRRKMHNKVITLALLNLNQESNPDMTVSVQKQSTDSRKGDQVRAADNKALSNTNSSKQGKKHTKEISLAAQNLNQESNLDAAVSAQRKSTDYRKGDQDTKEDQQESIHDNDSQNENEDLENRKKEKKALSMNDYVNESTSVPSEIKNLRGIDVVVDLNMESKPKQDKYFTCQQIEVTSPNRVTVMVPEDQLQTDSKEESFQIIVSIKLKGAGDSLDINAVFLIQTVRFGSCGQATT